MFNASVSLNNASELSRDNTMSTKVKITGAVFKCPTDEDIFFQRLSSVTGIESIVTNHSSLLISISNEQKDQALIDLIAICDIWHVSLKQTG